MARPESPVEGDGPLPDLVRELRRARERASSPGYREMAAAARFSRETLAAAARGNECPSWDVVKAFADACDPTGAEARKLRPLWQKASTAGGGTGRRRSPARRRNRPAPADKPARTPRPETGPPRPDPEGTAADYVYQLRALRAWAGNPGYKGTVAGHRNIWPMSRSTFYDVLSPRRTTLPPLMVVRILVEAYLDGNYLEDLAEWVYAWRAISHREFTSANPRPGSQLWTGAARRCVLSASSSTTNSRRVRQGDLTETPASLPPATGGRSIRSIRDRVARR